MRILLSLTLLWVSQKGGESGAKSKEEEKGAVGLSQIAYAPFPKNLYDSETEKKVVLMSPFDAEKFRAYHKLEVVGDGVKSPFKRWQQAGVGEHIFDVIRNEFKGLPPVQAQVRLIFTRFDIFA